MSDSGDPSRWAATTCLVVLAKAPEPGRVKTRLARSVGDGVALSVYRRLLAITASVTASWPGPVLVSITGDALAFAGTGLEHMPNVRQPVGDLGARITAALRAGLARAPAALVIGTDCPGLDGAALRAIAALAREAPVAFGPAADGGFWAIGTRFPAVASLLATIEVPWSTPRTLAVLCNHLTVAGIESRCGPTLVDCDTIDDLRRAVTAGLLPDDVPVGGAPDGAIVGRLDGTDRWTDGPPGAQRLPATNPVSDHP